ncbi:MAG: hypothetical protein U0931_11205 [Vulcanimicrobiota bacterium]
MLKIHSGSQWNQLQKRVFVGEHFAFFPPNCLEGGELNWLHQTFPEASALPARVLPLWSREAVELPGATHEGMDRLAAATAVLACDKQIYETMRDTVHLQVADPYHPGRRAVIKVRIDGADAHTIPIVLDRNGCGEALLTHLPAGNYTAQVVTETEASPECSFVVAEYRLVPLVAHFQERSTRAETLLFKVGLESFGQPARGPVQLSLMESGRLVEHQTVDCREGVLEAQFHLSGAGPFALNLQLVEQPDCTASLPIVGSRQQDREKTLLSSLGRTVECSLLPSESSVEVRGLHLEEGGQRTSPLRLERVDSETVRLRSAAPLQGLVVCLSDPTFPGLKAPAAQDFHPQQTDQDYRLGFKLYREKQFAESCQVFEAAWRKAALQGKAIHPYYPYNAACCHALLGRTQEAIFWLEHALRDGLKDFAMISADADFESLRENPRFQWLCQGGLRTLTVGHLEAGGQLELALEGSLALLAVGCFLESGPWEGRAVMVAPERIAPRLEVESQVAAGSSLKLRLSGLAGTAYVTVKDARLLAADTASSRLASSIKRLAEAYRSQSDEGPTTLAKLREKKEEINWSQFVESSPSNDPFARDWAELRAAPRFDAVSHQTWFPVNDPFGSASSDPFGSSAGDPFATSGFGAPASDPFAASASDPFAAPAGDPFAAADPFGAPAGPDPFSLPAGAAGDSLNDAPAPPPEPPRAGQQPQTLFAGRLEIEEGGGEVEIALPEHSLTLLVEVTFLAQRDWRRLEARCRVEADPYIDFQVTPFVQPGDQVLGRLRLHSSTRSGLRASVQRDGQPVELQEPQAGFFTFPLQPGFYECLVEDGDEQWRRSARVQGPGRLVSLLRTPRILQAGEKLCLDQNILGLKLLPNLDQPFRLCLQATADYEHLCCEQTAAKMVAACALWVFGGDDDKERAESIIQAGVRRLEGMWLKGRGFRMYPHSPAVPDSYWGPKASQYLWTFHSLRSAPGLAEVARRGLSMAEDTARAYGLSWPPSSIRSGHDAYLALRLQPGHGQALAYLQRSADGAGQSPVEQRIEAAYVAAALLLAGQQLPRALQLANQVTGSLNEQGRLYSTADSVAAIALLMTMKQLGMGGGSCELWLDGQSCRWAPGQPQPEFREISVEKGVALVEVTRLAEQDWSSFSATVPVHIDLHRHGQNAWRCKPGDALELIVRLEQACVTGDLVWVCLPDCLSRVVGGGQLKLFSVDFEGRQEVRIELAVTGQTGQGSQSFAVCVRNMYDESRVGNPGLLSVTAV